MANRDKTGPDGKGQKTGRGMGGCGTTEKQLGTQRGTGLGPRGNGKPRGGQGAGQGAGRGRGRRKGNDGITYF